LKKPLEQDEFTVLSDNAIVEMITSTNTPEVFSDDQVIIIDGETNTSAEMTLTNTNEVSDTGVTTGQVITDVTDDEEEPDKSKNIVGGVSAMEVEFQYAEAVKTAIENGKSAIDITDNIVDPDKWQNISKIGTTSNNKNTICESTIARNHINESTVDLCENGATVTKYINVSVTEFIELSDATDDEEQSENETAENLPELSDVTEPTNINDEVFEQKPQTENGKNTFYESEKTSTEKLVNVFVTDLTVFSDVSDDEDEPVIVCNKGTITAVTDLIELNNVENETVLHENGYAEDSAEFSDVTDDEVNPDNCEILTNNSINLDELSDVTDDENDPEIWKKISDPSKVLSKNGTSNDLAEFSDFTTDDEVIMDSWKKVIPKVDELRNIKNEGAKISANNNDFSDVTDDEIEPDNWQILCESNDYTASTEEACQTESVFFGNTTNIKPADTKVVKSGKMFDQFKQGVKIEGTIKNQASDLPILNVMAFKMKKKEISSRPNTFSTLDRNLASVDPPVSSFSNIFNVLTKIFTNSSLKAAPVETRKFLKSKQVKLKLKPIEDNLEKNANQEQSTVTETLKI
jgi:hypothetical protein